MTSTEISRVVPHVRQVDWRTSALCRTYRPEVFYPKQPGILTDKAKAICSRCPVAAPCLEHAMSPPFEHEGVWGGLTGEERVALRRRRQRIARRAASA